LGNLAAELGGLTLTPGVYRIGAAQITGQLRLNAQNDPQATFIFQIASTLITASNSSVVFINGASPCHVFWQVGSSATLGTGTDFVGTIMAQASISLTTGATLEGRALARTGAVTLDTNVITEPVCIAASPSTSTTVGPTGTPTGTPSSSAPPSPSTSASVSPSTSPTATPTTSHNPHPSHSPSARPTHSHKPYGGY
jgi:hypothetical protein